jgi:uncharacterized membrane protein
MLRTLAAALATMATMLVLDAIWLGLVAKPLYQQGIGHLMADTPRLGAAALFYVLYASGLLFLAVAPGGSWGAVATRAAVFGLAAYATFDLSNLATLKGWPVGLSVLDMAWGCGISTVAALAGHWTWLRLSPA